MASSATGQGNSVEVFPWLKTLPLAPEYHPTLAEFQDPIGYIFKIEKEASKYGICKIVPPVQPPPKKTAIANLNRSLAARSTSLNPKSMPTFTTRQQQIGFCPRKHRPVQKPVWQSGESYTLPQFEAKAKSFEKNYLKKSAKKALTPLEIETLYWKATVDKPFSVEYANDMPGSAFAQMSAKKSREAGEAATVGETAWNMRGVSRAKGSLLRFMKEEIPGVTSPMVYVAMMFSWFAWHVEDHDLHSLNYMHMGAGKTWYGVPREAAVAFEEVIRVHGYGGEINPIVTFATLGEKTTVMSPEVLLSAGVPCCRLVQNAGEFVVTFPRAYHSGFSHGFNCGEAANIATPEWLKVAKDAAIRRASTNCPPMVSHFQLLYDLALSLSSRMPTSISHQPRSSRLKDKKKGEGEALVKELFVQDVIQNNDLFHILGKGSPIILLPRISFEKLDSATSRIGSELKVNPRPSFGLRSLQGKMKTTASLISDGGMVLDRKQQGDKQFTGFNSMKEKFSSLSDGNRVSLFGGSDDATHYTNSDRGTAQYDRLPDRGLFSCVTCGILCFAGVAIIQPREAAARYLMSADCSNFNDWVVGSGVTTSDGFGDVSDDVADAAELISCSGLMKKNTPNGLFDVPIQSTNRIQRIDESAGVTSHTKEHRDTSSLGLLALNYGDSSDEEEDQAEADIPVSTDETDSREFSPVSRLDSDDSQSPSLDHYSEDEVPLHEADPYEEHERSRTDFKRRNHQAVDCSVEFETNDLSIESNNLAGRFGNQMKSPRFASNCSSVAHEDDAVIGNATVPIENTSMLFAPRSDEDSSRMHVFCLQHAVEVEQQLRPIGGVNMLLLCHPDYPELEAEAKSVAEELGSHHLWSKIEFRDADEEDKERIQAALYSEEAIHGNGDWAVKLGMNLFYSANLSRSPLYSKQMPYNSVIYDAFGRSSPANTPTKPKGSGKQKKIVVAGKWCGKVWMSNQVHPLLVQRDLQEQEVERNLPAPAKPDVKLERPSQRTHNANTHSASSKVGNKRKSMAESRSTIKAKYPKVEEPIEDSDDSPADNTHLQYRRNLRNKRMKTETPKPLRNSRARNSKQVDLYVEDELEGGPSTRLRKRTPKEPPKELESKPVEARSSVRKPQSVNNKVKKALGTKAPTGQGNARIRDEVHEEEGEYCCEMEGCTMSFGSKQELVLHKRNICPVKGCGKKFFSHKYLVQHRRVHMDDRPLKCPWKGCRMTFKWAWARTEHIRVHTGARPYACTEAGCGQTFRFVSDFSRHKRKTGHSTKKGSSR